jgi:micrococcal nuclease
MATFSSALIFVKAGYAKRMTIPPNVKYQERFLKAYREAMENNRGLWR